MLHTILLVFAFVCEALAIFQIPAIKVNLVAAGLAFYFLSLLPL